MLSEHRLSHTYSVRRLVRKSQLIAFIADEDTCVAFTLAGAGECRKGIYNFTIVDSTTTDDEIEEDLKFYLKRKDIAFVVIDQSIADRVREIIKDIFLTAQGRIIEIAPHYGDYNITQDVVYMAAMKYFGSDPMPLEPVLSKTEEDLTDTNTLI